MGRKAKPKAACNGRPPMGRMTAFIVVDCTERKKMDTQAIASILYRTPQEIEDFIAKLKSTGDWEKILKIRNMRIGPQALSHANNRRDIRNRTVNKNYELIHG